MVETGRASRTAVIVCQGRAAADGRLAPQRFRDPVAGTLLYPDELWVVDRVRAGNPPSGWSARSAYELVRSSAEVVVPRSVAIDDAIRERRNPQLVIVGAGLDTRAWRMDELAAVDVFEMDHPATQQDKRARIGDREPTSRWVRFVPIDFTRDRIDEALGAAGHQTVLPTTWVWEGVVPYLSRAAATATVQHIGMLSAPGSRLVVNYQAPAPIAELGRLAVHVVTLLARQRSPWSDEPRRSTWSAAAMAKLVSLGGFTVGRDDDLLSLAQQLGMPVRVRQSLHSGRIAVADI
jgi:methyltransferase (TIGR00027 family)